MVNDELMIQANEWLVVFHRPLVNNLLECIVNSNHGARMKLIVYLLK